MGRFQDLRKMRRIKSRRNLLWRRAATRKARNIRNNKRFHTLSLQCLPKHQPEVVSNAQNSNHSGILCNHGNFFFLYLLALFALVIFGEAVTGIPPPQPHRQVDAPMVNPALTIHQNVRNQQMDSLMTITLDTPMELKKMPVVTTTGDGPMGKRIQGFLYKYDADQVSIVCVCHGHVLSPQEFVIHAGGKEVMNPLKHITVSLCPI